MANGPFFPGPLVPIFGPCTCVCVVRCFAQFSMACVQFRPRRAPATFFPCPRTARCWSVYAYVAPMLFCPVLHGARPVPSTTGVGHFFPVFPYRPITGPCTCACPVRGFAQFCMSRVQLRARWASATFFPVSPYRPLWVRVRVGDMYVVLPSFPWRASGSVHGGRRPLFPRVPVQAIHGAVYESVYVCLPHTWLCPILHGARPVPSTPVSCPFLPGRMLLRFLPVSPFT